jgi:hypothetical protein
MEGMVLMSLKSTRNLRDHPILIALTVLASIAGIVTCCYKTYEFVNAYVPTGQPEAKGSSETLSPISPSASVGPSSTIDAIESVTGLPTPFETPWLVVLPTGTLPPTSLVPTQTFPPPVNGVLFEDNFDQGINPAWKQMSGTWITMDGRLTIIEDEYTIEWIDIGSSDWHSYRVEATIDRSRGDVYVGLRARALFYRISGHDCWTMDYSVNGDCMGDATAMTEPKRNFIFDVDGDQFTAYSNGSKLQTITFPRLPNGGVSIGILCNPGFACPSLDNFKVTALP